MKRRALILAIFLIAACEDDPTRSPRPLVDLTVTGSPVESLVDHGWADVNGRLHRMELEGDSLIVRGLELAPGELVIEVRAVDDNETDLLVGNAFGEAAPDSAAILVQVPLNASRPDLVLVGFSHEPEEPVAGDLVTIRVDLSNDGQGASGPTHLAVRVGAESQGELFDVPAMIPGQKIHIDRVVELNLATVYQILAFVDPRNRVPEVINTNNAAIGVISVGSPP